MSPALQLSTHQRSWSKGRAVLNDRYWRDPDYRIVFSAPAMRDLLRAHNYDVPASTPAMAARLHRIDRSLPCYANMPLSELRQFMQQRGIPHGGNMTFAQCVKALTLADGEARFEDFLSLPRELRDRVYSFYCSDFAHEALQAPVNPPLARTNRQLRDEALPIFYGECTFGLTLTASGASNSASGMPWKFNLSGDTLLLSSLLQPAHMACIQNLQIGIQSLMVGDFQPVDLRICMPRGKTPATSRLYLMDPHRHDSDLEVFDGPWRSLGDEVIDSVGLRELENVGLLFAQRVRGRGEGRNGLVLDDVYHLRQAIEDFFVRRQG